MEHCDHLGHVPCGDQSSQRGRELAGTQVVCGP